MLELVEHLRKIVPNLPFDIRAEVVAADLIARGMSPDEIILAPQSLFKRRFSRDILAVTTEETKGGKEYCLLQVSREGIYDALPQALTHTQQSGRHRGIKTKKEMTDEVKLRRKEEKAARLFFLPYENEFYHQRIFLEMQEQRILHGYLSDSHYTQLLDQFWNLPEILDMQQKAMLIYMLPILNKIVGNLELMRICYETILQTPVKLQVKYGYELPVADTFILNKESASLGVNTVCGKKCFLSKPIVIFHVGPLSTSQLTSFMPGNRKRKELEALHDFLLPLETESKVNLEVKMPGETTLSKKSEIRVGYNFHLTKASLPA